MLDFIRTKPIEAITFGGMCIAAVLFALHKLGWISIKGKWDGTERRTCTDHTLMQNKVCTLHNNLDDISDKLDTVAEKVQYILGLMEARWGKKM